MADSEYESVLCVKNEVFVYQIPARTSNRGYRAADWNLDKPNWVGRMKVISKGKSLFIRLEDKNTGELFAKCPVDSYPGIAVEQVLDSSRYFVIRIQDENGRKAFIGIGFADRGDSFDLLVAMQDHFKWIKREETQLEEQKDNKDLLSSGPKLDLGFKEGQTIRINIATKKNREHGSPSNASKQRSRGQSTGTGILPPPPGGTRIAPPPRAPSAISASPSHQNDQQTDLLTGSQPKPEKTGNSSGSHSNVDLLLNFESSCTVSSSTNEGSTGSNAPTQEPQKAAKPAESADPWGDFTSATSTKPGNQSNQQTGGWVSFE